MTTDHRHTDPKHARRPHRDDDQPETPRTESPEPPTDRSDVPMREVSHTNPYTDESMGSLFEHGVTVVADGGKRNAADEPADESVEDEDDAETASTDASETTPSTQMKDVSHEAPEGGHGNRMFERVGDTTDVPDETVTDESVEDE